MTNRNYYTANMSYITYRDLRYLQSDIHYLQELWREELKRKGNPDYKNVRKFFSLQDVISAAILDLQADIDSQTLNVEQRGLWSRPQLDELLKKHPDSRR